MRGPLVGCGWMKRTVTIPLDKLVKRHTGVLKPEQYTRQSCCETHVQEWKLNVRKWDIKRILAEWIAGIIVLSFKRWRHLGALWLSWELVVCLQGLVVLRVLVCVGSKSFPGHSLVPSLYLGLLWSSRSVCVRSITSFSVSAVLSIGHFRRK